MSDVIHDEPKNEQAASSAVETIVMQTETQFLQHLIGEIEQCEDYSAETVIDGIEHLIQKRIEDIETSPDRLEDQIKLKIKELLELVPESGHLAITGFDNDELTVYQRKSIGIYTPVVIVQDPKIQG